MWGRMLLGIGVGLLVGWIALAVFLALARPGSGRLKESLRLLPDTIRLLRRLVTDEVTPKGVKVRLWLLFAYLSLPIDLVPDFVPVLGYADDAIIVAAVLRSVVRRAGPEAIQKHWRGTDEGLAALWRAARLGDSFPLA